MKLVIASGIYEPEIGGPTTYINFIAPALVKNGWDVKLLTFSKKKHVRTDKNKSFKIYRITKKGKIGLLTYFLQLLKTSKNTDIIFSQGSLLEGIPAYFASKLLNKKLIIRIPGDCAWEEARNKGILDSIETFQKKKYSLKIELKKFLRKFITKQARTIIVPSKYLSSIVRKWGIPECKIKLISNTAYTKKVKKTKLNIKKPYILTAGRFVPWKNIDVIIRAFEKVRIKNLKLLIIGEGPQEKYLKRIARRNVIFMSSLKNDVFLNYLQNAEAFILASDYEGLSHTLLEAMSVGTAVIATNIPSNKELIKNKKTGLLFPINDEITLSEKIKIILEDKNLKKLIETNAKKKLTKPEKIIKEIMRVLKNEIFE